MADPNRKRTRPRDPNQLAKLVFDIASGEVEDSISENKRHPKIVKGRAGGKKGGKSKGGNSLAHATHRHCTHCR